MEHSTLDHAPAAGADPGPGKIAETGVTFDDVLLIPRRSDVLPAAADVATRLTRELEIRLPLVSAPMDTVTEAQLAVALAQEGGLGVIHKNLTIEDQAREVEKVKRSASGVILDPVTLGPSETVGAARDAMARYNVSGFPVVEGGSAGARTRGKVLGILTRRDLKWTQSDDALVRDVMTGENLVTATPDTTLEDANRILSENKVEKLLLVDGDFNLAGLITRRDIDRLSQFPSAVTDPRGRLLCGAAIGARQLERAEALIAAGADVVTVDSAHGHSVGVLETVREIKKTFEIQVIGGNVATAEGARDLIEAGADAVKVGIGPGSICTTRVVTGVGVPQITAVMNAARGAAGTGVPVVADGGVRMSGDIAKALAAGASAVMMGSLFAGLDEAPGELVISHGRRYKSYRGMGSEGAMSQGSADRYGQSREQRGEPRGDDDGNAAIKFVPEGVEGLVPYRGPLAEYVFQLVGGIRSAMGYCGCATLAEFREHTRFTRITAAGSVESHPHNITITKESPNYTAPGDGTVGG